MALLDNPGQFPQKKEENKYLYSVKTLYLSMLRVLASPALLLSYLKITKQFALVSEQRVRDYTSH